MTVHIADRAFASLTLAALTGRIRGPLVPRPQGAMHGFGGIRHSPLGMTTLHIFGALEKARYASSRRLALFFGAPHPFLWARPKKWGGKGFYKGLPLFCPAARRPRYARRRSLLAAQSAALYIQAQCGGEDAGGDAAGVRDIDHREGGGLARAGGAGIYNGHAAGVADAGDVRVPV